MSVPVDSRGNPRPVRDYEIISRKRAMAAARKLIEAGGQLNREQVATEFEALPGNISLALVVLHHGTAEEIASVESGMAGLRVVYDEVSKRVPAQERIKTKMKRTFSAERKEQHRNDAAIWKQLREAIDLICGMPRPADVAAIAKRNYVRTAILDRKIIDAYSWLSEFSDAWTK